MRTMYFAKIRDTHAITGFSDELGCFNVEPMKDSRTCVLFSESEKDNRDFLECTIDDGEETVGDLVDSGALEWVAVQIPDPE